MGACRAFAEVRLDEAAEAQRPRKSLSCQRLSWPPPPPQDDPPPRTDLLVTVTTKVIVAEATFGKSAAVMATISPGDFLA